MIKTLIPLLLLFLPCLQLSAHAQAAGTKAASFGLNGVDGDIAVSGELGYYFIDNLELGVQASYGTEGDDVFAGGPYAELYFNQLEAATGFPLTPYIGASWNYYNADGESTSGFTGQLGARYLVTPGVGLYGAYEYRTAGEDIFVDDGELTDSDGRFTYGVGFFF